MTSTPRPDAAPDTGALDREHAQLLEYVGQHPGSYAHEIGDKFRGRWECGWPIPGIFYVNSFLGDLIDAGYLRKEWDDVEQSSRYTATSAHDADSRGGEGG